MTDLAASRPPRMSPDEFANLGAPEVVYVRPVRRADGRVTFNVHAANGTELARDLPSFAQAVVASRQNELRPVSLH